IGHNRNRSQQPSVTGTDLDGEQMLNAQNQTLRVEDGLRAIFSLIPFDNEAIGDKSSSSMFTTQPVYFSLLKIWECLVRYYIKIDKLVEANQCLDEASRLCPLSHQLFYIRGLICDAKRELKLAKQNYNDALAIHPYHFQTLIQMTKLLIEIGNYALAEKYARDAIAVEPANYEPWYLLSLSMEARGEYEHSVDVAATAVHLEENTPLVSYTTIMRVL
ncbi:unnamed protein product, partial [Didymodactylos carnosus]